MSIRLRLTLLYAGAFFAAGAVLVAVIYFSADHLLERRAVVGSRRLIEQQRPYTEWYQAVAEHIQQNRRETLRGILIWSLVSLGVIGVAAGGIGWLLAGRALRPLQQITATARRVADRSLHERIALKGPDDEIKDLADTFDAMLERLDRAFDGQRRFVANASHELRTPLTINRTLVEVAISDPQTPESTRQLGTTLLAVNERHERLIDGLLVLASSDQQLSEQHSVDLHDVAAHAGAVNAIAAQRGGVEIRTDLHSAPVLGDRLLLERLAHNLLDNAIRYNMPEHGWVQVSSKTVDGQAQLVVENCGPGVSPALVDGLFEPFRRMPSTERIADAARGAGLGLSIVRSVAHAHDGEVTATARPDGGLTVIVSLPAQ